VAKPTGLPTQASTMVARFITLLAMKNAHIRATTRCPASPGGRQSLMAW
jgi:hypothetical protein